MKISASDPDIETLVRRIEKGELDLRPDFQRGEVWPDSKRQKLIDTVLRGWQVPPVHLVSVVGTSQLEVLDGQQRLAAIRDFAQGRLRIDGWTEPIDQSILALDRLTFGALEAHWQRRFNQYPIRVFTITEYQPGEPYELFYRLNQPTRLTAAEQRNAFFGPAREQVKELVALAQESGLNRDSVGFSNGRMAYDDVLARACMFFEAGTFHARVTGGELNDKYRSGQAFSPPVISAVKSAIHLFSLARASLGRKLRLNKATLLSWLLFAANNDALGGDGALLSGFVSYFEERRIVRTTSESPDALLTRQWIGLFDDRASSRVNDTLSVAARDFVLWLFFAASEVRYRSRPSKLETAAQALSVLRARAEANEYIEPGEFVERLLERRAWDLTDASS